MTLSLHTPAPTPASTPASTSAPTSVSTAVEPDSLNALPSAQRDGALLQLVRETRTAVQDVADVLLRRLMTLCLEACQAHGCVLASAPGLPRDTQNTKMVTRMATTAVTDPMSGEPLTLSTVFCIFWSQTTGTRTWLNCAVHERTPAGTNPVTGECLAAAQVFETPRIAGLFNCGDAQAQLTQQALGSLAQVTDADLKVAANELAVMLCASVGP